MHRLVLVFGVLLTCPGQAQAQTQRTQLGIAYPALVRNRVDSTMLRVTQQNGRTTWATSNPVVSASGPWTLYVELVAPVSPTIKTQVIPARGSRVLMSANSRVPVATSASPCARCVVTVDWMFVSTGRMPAPVPPPIRFVLGAIPAR